MLSDRDLGWAAGFLEGEGTFYSGHGIGVTAAQVQREPLERLQRLFGGKISRRLDHRKITHHPCHKWYTSGFRAAAIMMTVYSLMSPKRQEKIYKALAQWKASEVDNRLKKRCPKGHLLRGVRKDGRRYCLACVRDLSARRYAKQRKQKMRCSGTQEMFS